MMMKRSEIRVGGAYYYNRHTNWQSDNYGGKRIVVVADGLWKMSKFRPFTPKQVDKNGGLLVDMYPHDGDEHPTREVVPAAHLRGPYEETAAQVAGWIAANRNRDQVEADKRSTAHTAARRVVERAEALGFPSRTDGPNVVMSPDVLDRLLEAMENGR